MTELFQFIFSSLWVWLGTLVMIYVIGHALALPFFWWYKVKQFKMNRQTWEVN